MYVAIDRANWHLFLVLKEDLKIVTELKIASVKGGLPRHLNGCPICAAVSSLMTQIR